MVNNFITSKKERGLQNLIWETLSLIMKKASVEFRGGMKKVVDHGSWNETITIPDSRKEYIQLVEFLSDIVIQEIDQTEIKKVETSIATELKKYTENKIDKETYVLKKLELMRKMLRLILTELKVKDYLKGASYSEGDVEDEESD